MTSTARLACTGCPTSPCTARVLGNWWKSEGWTRSAYEVSQFVPLGALILLGLIFYALGAPTRRRLADVPIGAEPVTPPMPA